MAISYVGGQEAGRAGANNTQNISFNLTGGTDSTPQAGDLVIITAVVGTQGRNPAQAISGYTALGQLNAIGATYDTSLNVSWKFMGSTPDTSFTLPSTGNNQDAQSYTVQVFRGVDATTPFDATPTTATSTSTTRYDAAAITPVTAGAWILICGGGAAATGANYTAPTDFATNFLTGFDADTNDSLIGSGYYTGWTSGAYNPAAVTGGAATGSAAVYTLALRPAPDSQDLTPDRYDNTSTIYGPSVTLEPYILTASPVENTSVFYAATVGRGPVALTAARYDNDQTFYSPSVLRGTITLQPGLYTNGQTFYAATVERIGGVDLQVSWVVFDTQGGDLVNLLPSLLQNANTFYAHAVSPGPVSLTPNRYDNAQTFYAPTVNRGAVTLQPGLYSNANTLYPATVTAGGVTLTPARFDNESVFYAATVSVVTTNTELLPGLLTNTSVIYGPTVVGAGVVLAPDRYDNTSAFYSATLTGSTTLVAGRFDNSNTFYQPTVSVAGVVLLPALFTNTNTFFAATVRQPVPYVLKYWDGSGWQVMIKEPVIF
jgi:hypothetical protein